MIHLEESIKKGIRNGIYGAIVGFILSFSVYIWVIKKVPIETTHSPLFVGLMMVVGALGSALYWGLFVFFITLIVYYFKNRKKKQ